MSQHHPHNLNHIFNQPGSQRVGLLCACKAVSTSEQAHAIAIAILDPFIVPCPNAVKINVASLHQPHKGGGVRHRTEDTQTPVPDKQDEGYLSCPETLFDPRCFRDIAVLVLLLSMPGGEERDLV
jgi:hypothetical protein